VSRIPNLASERGAVLIQTAMTALVLVGFGTFVVDYGVLWVGRHQAQNAADAGAMAGAIARAYDDFDDPPDPGGVAAQNASQVAGANLVWGASSPTTGAVTSFPCPAEVVAVDPNSRCVKVDVFRNGENGSTPLPTWFAPVLGLTSQGVKATASARVLVANATNCLRPWAIPDKWIEGAAGPDFLKYAPGGAPLASQDTYNPPTASDPGTGLTFPTSNAAPADLGLSLALTLFTDLTNQILPGWLVPLEPPAGYFPSVAACNGEPITVGDQIPISGTLPVAGHFIGLVDQDGTASWNAVSKTIDGSCAPVCAPLSPRLVALAVFDVDIFQYRQATLDWNACPPGSLSCVPCPLGNPCVSVVNIVGFFIVDASPIGHLTSYPGVIPTEPPRLTAESSFLKAITLVR